MDLITISLVTTTLINAVLGLVLILNARRYSFSELYSFNVLMIILWSGSMVLFRLAGPESIVFLTKLLYVSATFIASTFLYFCFVFPEKSKSLSFQKQLIIFLTNALIILVIIFSDLIIVSVNVNPVGENIIQFGSMYFFYVLYVLLFFMYGFWILFRKYLTLDQREQKLQIIYLLIGYAISANIAFVTNLLLPWFGFFELNWLGQISTVTMVAFATIAILKHQLFNIKVIVTELFVFALWLFIFIRMLLQDSFQDQAIDVVLLIVSIILGILLIRGVLKEVNTREQLEKLTHDLEKANIRLKELDQLKSEFVSIASHQLRSPLTSIKGYASMLLEGSYGKFPEKAKEALSRIFKSTNLMADSIEDFLNVSRIEQGRMKYNKTNFDAAKLAETVVEELGLVASKKNLTLSFEADVAELFMINADLGKIKQVFSNLIDNSIKYTTTGSVTVSVSKRADMIQFKVSDTGVGISKKTLERLFDKFVRARNAHKINVSGTGLGLYVAKQMIEAHGGKIWAESDGEGKGSTFFVELKVSKYYTESF